MNNYIYIFIRKDLSNSQKIVQACHSVVDLAKNNLFDNHPYIIILGVKDELSLLRESYRISELTKIKPYSFREPDLNNQLTSVAFLTKNDEERAFFKKYNLLNDKSFLINF